MTKFENSWGIHMKSILTYLPMKMEQTECSETSAYKIQTPGNYPEENIQHWPCLSMDLYVLGAVTCSCTQSKSRPHVHKAFTCLCTKTVMSLYKGEWYLYVHRTVTCNAHTEVTCSCTQDSWVLTLILLTWRIGWAPNNASKWQMEFNSAFKGLMNNRHLPLSSCKAVAPVSCWTHHQILI
jgi:hypothetical protein